MSYLQLLEQRKYEKMTSFMIAKLNVKLLRFISFRYFQDFSLLRKCQTFCSHRTADHGFKIPDRIVPTFTK